MEDLGNLLADGFISVSVKYNRPDLVDASYDIKELWEDAFEEFSGVRGYVRETSKNTILACVSGLYLLGKKKIPHFHFVFLVSSFTEGTNPSQYRRRWCSKNGFANFSKNITFSVDEVKNHKEPAHYALCYALKEGHYDASFKMYYIKENKMPAEILLSLASIGKSLFEASQELNARKDRHELRKKESLNDLYEIVKDKHFASYADMLAYLETEFLDKIDLDEMPDFANYQKNTLKIGKKMGILKWSDLILKKI